LLTAFFAVDFELFTAGDTAFVFFGIERMTICAGDEIERAGFSPRDEILLVIDRPNDEVQRQTQDRGKKRDQQDAHGLQSGILCPGKDILSHPDDGDDPQKDKDDQDKIHYSADTIHLE
jgi:hypothetical protein